MIADFDIRMKCQVTWILLTKPGITKTGIDFQSKGNFNMMRLDGDVDKKGALMAIYNHFDLI
jgi:hypothetical protein